MNTDGHSLIQPTHSQVSQHKHFTTYYNTTLSYHTCKHTEHTLQNNNEKINTLKHLFNQLKPTLKI